MSCSRLKTIPVKPGWVALIPLAGLLVLTRAAFAADILLILSICLMMVILATIWLVAGSTMLSAYFILAANSWMQHPVGYKMVDGKAQLTSIWAVLTNSTALMAFAHTIIAALMTGALAERVRTILQEIAQRLSRMICAPA